MNCARHVGADATWSCNRCNRWHCTMCVRWVGESRAKIAACAACDGTLVKAAETMTAGDVEPVALAGRVFTLDGLLTALAVGIFGWFASLASGGFTMGFGWAVRALYLAILSALYFGIIRHIGSGKPGLPDASSYIEDWEDVGRWAARGISCLLIGQLPLFIYIFTTDEFSIYTALNVALMSCIYMPAVVLAVTLSESALAAFWPVAWVRIALRAPRSYFILIFLFVAAVVLWWLVSGVVAAALSGVPFHGFFVSAASTMMLMVQAAIVGGFLRRHASDFGY